MLKKWRWFLLILSFITIPGQYLHAQDAGLKDAEPITDMPALSRQQPGTPFIDPAFGTSITRITDAGERGGFGTQIYSQLQAFSPDNQYVLLIEDEWYTIRRMDDFSPVDIDTALWNAPRWLPSMPHTIVHYDGNDNNIVAVEYSHIENQVTETVFTFPSEYTHIRVSQSFDELSHDGRWMSGMLTREDEDSVIFALNLETMTIGATLPISELFENDCDPDPEWGILEPDWIGVSPAGNYLVVQWVRDGTERCSGLETFDLETGEFIGRVYDGHQHGDSGITEDGQEFFMTFELSSLEDVNRPAIAMRMLPGNDIVSDPIHLLTVDWSDSGHISCQGLPGVCLISNGVWYDDPWTALEGELYLLDTQGNVQRLTHHRSTSCAYWVQPRASISRDGRYVIFASDWGFNDDSYQCDDSLGHGDAYIIDLEAMP